MRYTYFLFAVLLTACNSVPEEPIVSFSNGYSTSSEHSIDQSCVNKRHDLEKMCSKESVETLSLNELQDCWILIANKDVYDYECNEGRMKVINNVYLDVFLSPNNRPSESGDTFIDAIQNKCQKTKIGDMTLPDLRLCAKTFEHNEMVEFLNLLGDSNEQENE